MNMVAQLVLERRLVSIMYKFDVVSSSFAGPLRVSVSDGNSITYISWSEGCIT